MNRVGIASVGVVLVLATALAGCGGSSKAKSAPTTVPSPAKDRATAESLVLHQTDFPSGWAGKPHQSDASDARIAKQLSTCVGASDPSTQTAKVDRPDVDKGGAEVSTSAAFAASAAAFAKDSAALRSAKYTSCLKTLFATELQAQISKSTPGVTISNLNLQKVSTPTYGDVTVELRLSMTITGGAQTAKLYIDDISYGKDRAEVDLTFSNTGAPFDATLEKSLVEKAVAKLKTLS